MTELRTDAARRFHQSYHADRGQRCPIDDGDTPSPCGLAETLDLVERAASLPAKPDAGQADDEILLELLRDHIEGFHGECHCVRKLDARLDDTSGGAE